jgi:hypothetical protein
MAHSKNFDFKTWMQNRRADLRAAGMCVDCGKLPVKPGVSHRGKPHSCCQNCLNARSERQKIRRMVQTNFGVGAAL